MNRKRCALNENSMHFERLESRRVMAGNVNAELIDGSLFLDGDAAANGIAIVATGNPDELQVTGTPAFAGDVTQLNAQDGPLTFVVTKDIVVHTGAGNDGVELNNVHVPRNLTIETGDGLDRVSIGSSVSETGIWTAQLVAWPPVTERVAGGAILNPPAPVEAYPDGSVRPAGTGSSAHPAEFIDPYSYRPLNHSPGSVGVVGDISIATGDASDYVFLGYTHVGRDIAIRTGDGDDIFVVQTVTARNLDVGLDGQRDLANIVGLTTRGQMTLATGFGNDFVSFAASHAYGPATFLGGHGDNQFYIGASVFSDSLYAEFGIDNDRLVIRSSMLLGNSNFVTAAGGDRIDINYSYGRFVGASTGDQGDSINIVGSALDNIYAGLGDGDDSLSLVGSRILYPFIADGGTGAGDVIHEFGSAGYYTGLSGFEHKSHVWPSWLSM